MIISVKLKNKGDDLEKLGKDTSKYFMRASKELLVSDLKNETPVKEGNLRNVWHVKNITDTRLVVENSAKYGVFPDRGTGLLGEYHRLITPKHASVMRARIDGQIVYFKSSKGQKPQHFVEKGVKQFKPHIPNLLRTAIIKTRNSGVKNN